MDWNQITSNPWLLITSGALLGVLGACFRHVRSFWSYLSSWLIGTAEIDRDVYEALRQYFAANGTRLSCHWNYLSGTFRVKDLDASRMVGMAAPPKSGCYWMKGPVWLSAGSSQSNVAVRAAPTFNGGNSPRDDNEDTSAQFRWIRGVTDREALIKDALDFYYTLSKGGITNGDKLHVSKRHVCQTHYGSLSSSQMSMESPGNMRTRGRIERDNNIYVPHLMPATRFVGYEKDELEVGQNNSAIDSLASLYMSPDCQQMVQDVEVWLQSERWYNDRNISWQRNYLLYGLPGTGKTSVIRALAQHFDLPLHSFVLPTMSDSDLKDQWRESFSYGTTNIALFEDMHTVYKGDALLSQGPRVTTLLNLLDGVSRNSGLLIFMTTNEPDTMPPAICQLDGDRVSRPGRVDVAVHMPPPDPAGLELIADNILRDYSKDSRQEVVEQGRKDGDTGAQFVNRCQKLALRTFWELEVARKNAQHIGA